MLSFQLQYDVVLQALIDFCCMTRKEFEQLVAEGFTRLPEQFRKKIKNVGFLVEDEPSAAVRKEVGLRGAETLLGFYRGIPRTVRGADYGIGTTLPDVIYIYRKPTEEEARYRLGEGLSNNKRSRTIAKSERGVLKAKTRAETGSPDASLDAFRKAVREVVAETVWHEVGHYFGLDEEAVAQRELKQKSL